MSLIDEFLQKKLRLLLHFIVNLLQRQCASEVQKIYKWGSSKF
jgi:hypothetical protein